MRDEKRDRGLQAPRTGTQACPYIKEGRGLG